MFSLPLSGADAPTLLTNAAEGPTAIIFSEERLFFLSILYVGKGIVSSLVPGQNIVTIVRDQTYEKFNGLALDETSVYWAVVDGIRSVPREGGDTVTVVSTANNPRSFALDEDAIYWTNDGRGIWRAPKRPTP